jgi:iron complex transport system substrate-binding protein
MRCLRRPEPWRINRFPAPTTRGSAALSRRFIVRATNPHIRLSLYWSGRSSSGTRRALVWITLLIGLVGCSRAPENSGLNSEDPAPLVLRRQRVVSLTPSITHLVQGLGRGDRLVGTSRHGQLEGVPIVADLEPRIEAILKVDPDLVLIGRYPSLKQDIEALRAHGLQVLDLPLDSLDDMRAAIEILGDRLQAEARASILARELQQALKESRRMATRWANDPPKVLLVFDIMDGTVFTTGGGDHLAEILEVAGAVNVAQGGPITSRLSLEKVTVLAPEIIIHVAQSDRFPDSQAALEHWKRIARVPAVERQQVHVWPDDSLATHGPSLPSAIRRFVGLVQRATEP